MRYQRRKSFDTSAPPCLFGWRSLNIAHDCQLVGVGATKRFGSGHGGSRKGQSMNLIAYTTKAKFASWKDMVWDDRIGDIVRTMRLLGCEWPTETTSKMAATVAMLWESVEAPQFDRDAKQNAFQNFKNTFNTMRQCETFAGLTHLHCLKAHFDSTQLRITHKRV